MSFYICSCGILFGECKDNFNECCRIKGHTLFCVDDGVYRLIYDLHEINSKLRQTIKKRNKNISFLKEKISELITELETIKISKTAS